MVYSRVQECPLSKEEVSFPPGITVFDPGGVRPADLASGCMEAWGSCMCSNCVVPLPLFLVDLVRCLVYLLAPLEAAISTRQASAAAFKQWAGQRLLSEKVTRPHVRANRPVSISSVAVSEGIEIGQGCLFLSSLLGALAKLPGGICRF